MRILFHPIFFLLLACILCLPVHAAEKTHFILTGSPALRKWEDLRKKSNQHDRWWGNFIRASTLRMVEIRQAYGKKAKIVWAVHKTGYIKRSAEDGKPLPKWIEKQAAKRNVKLIWFKNGKQAINAINRQSNITTFDFFGHSNRHCFLFDYSSRVSGASGSWLHENELHLIRRKAFSPKAICQSWGCHTGESMSHKWKRQLGVSLIGAEGKTDYSKVGQGKMPSISGRWIKP